MGGPLPGAGAGRPDPAPTGDYAVRAVAANGSILAFAARTSGLCEQARRRHDCWPTAAAALGRVLTAAALLAVPMKDGGTLTVRVRGDGPLGGILATATPDGDVRGYAARPHVDLPARRDGKLDVGGAVGARGVLSVIRETGGGAPYTGSAPLVSGEIGDDFTAYLARSEQVPSLVALGVLVGTGGRVRAAGGLVVQMLPGAPEDAATGIEANVADLGGVSRRIEEGLTPEALVDVALGGRPAAVTQTLPLRFRCTCGRRRVASALAALPPHEVDAMREQDGGAEVTCRFCGRRYQFSAEDLSAVAERARRRTRGDGGAGGVVPR